LLDLGADARVLVLAHGPTLKDVKFVSAKIAS